MAWPSLKHNWNVFIIVLMCLVKFNRLCFLIGNIKYEDCIIRRMTSKIAVPLISHTIVACVKTLLHCLLGIHSPAAKSHYRPERHWCLSFAFPVEIPTFAGMCMHVCIYMDLWCGMVAHPTHRAAWHYLIQLQCPFLSSLTLHFFAHLWYGPWEHRCLP